MSASGKTIWSVVTHNYEVYESRIRDYGEKKNAKQDFYAQILHVNNLIEEDAEDEEEEDYVEELFTPFSSDMQPYQIETSEVKRHASDGAYWVILLVEHIIF